MKYVQKAINLEPLNQEGYILRNKIIEKFNLDMAEAELEKTLQEIKLSRCDYYNRLAWIKLKQHRINESREYFILIENICKKRAYYLDRAFMEYLDGKFDVAKYYMEKALQEENNRNKIFFSKKDQEQRFSNIKSKIYP